MNSHYQHNATPAPPAVLRNSELGIPHLDHVDGAGDAWHERLGLPFGLGPEPDGNGIYPTTYNFKKKEELLSAAGGENWVSEHGGRQRPERLATMSVSVHETRKSRSTPGSTCRHEEHLQSPARLCVSLLPRGCGPHFHRVALTPLPQCRALRVARSRLHQLQAAATLRLF
ncbi:hypothetical protein GHT09_003281 [Marmota monax]|uniref:Uncharacterized protein n=1 Tax=Marmota monax TaxID=9995 RepID=A0A834UMJ3_MARMO|nr:hypothetical protein GHT09_003281 [Marmota monax]